MEDAMSILDQERSIELRVESVSNRLQAIVEGIQSSIIGNQDTIRKIVLALISGGHVLIEGLPGVAKTKMVVTLARFLGIQMQRVQCTPDLLPSDITGMALFRPDTGNFEIHKGPIFTNIMLADEINRTPPKVQAALLEAMAEKQVTLFGSTELLPTPFFVLATQNPIEQEGTYPLPEAQLDRFMMKLIMKSLTVEDEEKIIQQAALGLKKEKRFDTVIDGSRVVQEAMELMKSIYVDPAVIRYIAEIVIATRDSVRQIEMKIDQFIRFGASSRASIALLNGARAAALLEKRIFVTPHDVKQIAKDVLRHRIGLHFQAEAKGITVDQIVDTILSLIPVP
ncbi:MAG: AAA family ATPase [Chlamydia sp.]